MTDFEHAVMDRRYLSLALRFRLARQAEGVQTHANKTVGCRNAGVTQMREDDGGAEELVERERVLDQLLLSVCPDAAPEELTRVWEQSR
jgi:hypothetical protein